MPIFHKGVRVYGLVWNIFARCSRLQECPEKGRCSLLTTQLSTAGIPRINLVQRPKQTRRHQDARPQRGLPRKIHGVEFGVEAKLRPGAGAGEDLVQILRCYPQSSILSKRAGDAVYEYPRGNQEYHEAFVKFAEVVRGKKVKNQHKILLTSGPDWYLR